MGKGPTKYVVVGGWVKARDGQWRYVSGRRLVDLYRVDLGQCLVLNWHDSGSARVVSQAHADGLVVLMPREDGRYWDARSRGETGVLDAAAADWATAAREESTSAVYEAVAAYVGEAGYLPT